jgi:hypothetical protein
MEKSENLNELATALSAAQAEIEDAEKSRSNPAFRSKYADLGAIVDACKPALTKHGLAFSQVFEPSEAGVLRLTTMLLHQSGQWLAGTITMPLAKVDPQGYGSAATYARRYGLAAIVGVCPEDDDAQAASAPRQQAESRGDQRAASQPPAEHASPGRSEREDLIGQVHTLFKELHATTKFYPWCSGVLKREVGGISDLEFADLRALHRHLSTEKALLEGQARQQGKLAQEQGA